MGTVMPKNDTIFKRLEQATEVEREEICKILKLDTNRSNDIEKISAEFRSVSGHTVGNLLRSNVHDYEYLDILKDTWNGVKNSKYFNPKIDLTEEQSIENRLEIVFNSILKNTKNSKKVKEEISYLGKQYTFIDVAIGPAGASGLLVKFISAPIAIVTTVVSSVTAPSYSKSFLVVAKLIDIKRRLRAEELLKD